MTDPHKSKSIPDFASREEEAAFWDMQDITDYLDELRPLQVRFAKNLSEGITVRFDPETSAELRAVAQDLGIGPSTLMRMWVLERLKEVRKERATE